MANTRQLAIGMPNEMANGVDVANAATAPGRNRASSTYRYRTPDKRRAYQRNLMRRRRAERPAA